jgi:hypothetical protein
MTKLLERPMDDILTAHIALYLDLADLLALSATNKALLAHIKALWSVRLEKTLTNSDYDYSNLIKMLINVPSRVFYGLYINYCSRIMANLFIELIKVGQARISLDQSNLSIKFHYLYSTSWFDFGHDHSICELFDKQCEDKAVREQFRILLRPLANDVPKEKWRLNVTALFSPTASKCQSGTYKYLAKVGNAKYPLEEYTGLDWHYHYIMYPNLLLR